MPFSYDAIDQVAVEFAPYDVQYGGFSACVVNAVTKSGGNELSASAFYEFKLLEKVTCPNTCKLAQNISFQYKTF